jgi:hypothetical protein
VVENGGVSAKGYLVDLRFDRKSVRAIEVQSRLIAADAKAGEIEFTFVETDAEGRALVLEHSGAAHFSENAASSVLRVTAHEIHAQRDGYYALETRVLASSDESEIDAESVRYDFLRVQNGVRTQISEQEYDEATSTFANEYNGERVRRGSIRSRVVSNAAPVEAGRVTRGDEPLNKVDDERGQP